MWFLGYLMVFSVLARPLFLFAGAQENRAVFARATFWCGEPWALCVLGFPILLIKLALDASFPSHTDWSETLVFATFYCYGWLFVAEPRFLRKVVDQAAVGHHNRHITRARRSKIACVTWSQRKERGGAAV